MLHKLTGLFSILVLTNSLANAAPKLPHLDLEMTSEEYRSLLEATPRGIHFELFDDFNPILEVGKKNLDWITLINKSRTPSTQLQLSTPALQPAYPIDQPSTSNPTIIQTRYTAAQAQMPAAMAAILFKGGALTSNAPVDDVTFLKSARDLDRVYQMASRWLLEEPFLDQYTARASRDIRGYYFLGKEPGLDSKLKNWQSQDAATQAKIRPWLVGLCVNSTQSSDSCESDLNAAISSARVADFYSQYVQGGKDTYDSFFTIQNPRSDTQWNSTAHTFTVPFINPDRDEVKAWAQFNIQDEWHFGNWKLLLDFVSSGEHPHVIFIAGATPHVAGLGGNEITMDANRELNEYSTKWTIRHEFGHTLGFPDCYQEFYDVQSQSMIQYQLDTANLMCSRRGHIQQRHLDELTRNYQHR